MFRLGLQSTPSLNRLRRATVAWVMDISVRINKYLDRDFWMNQSDSLYARGKAPGLKDTQRAGCLRSLRLLTLTFLSMDDLNFPCQVA